LKIVSSLLIQGAKLKNVSDNIANNHSVGAMKLWGIALDRLQYDDQNKICYSVIVKKDFETSGASMDDVSGLVNLINAVP
jgi:nanoRNase/pAp phosphatase (c-di-AMP/oligoRNAs hydrolase)